MLKVHCLYSTQGTRTAKHSIRPHPVSAAPTNDEPIPTCSFLMLLKATLKLSKFPKLPSKIYIVRYGTTEIPQIKWDIEIVKSIFCAIWFLFSTRTHCVQLSNIHLFSICKGMQRLLQSWLRQKSLCEDSSVWFFCRIVAAVAVVP